MNSLLALFSSTVFAAESIISPIPQHFRDLIHSPMTSFGTIIENQQVLGASIEITPTPTPEKEIIHVTKKPLVTIALLGDSMIDTLGPDLPTLTALLNAYYPRTKMRILNYGVGATNADDGLARLTRDYTYQGRHMNPLISEKPDLVVVESFGYNPYVLETGYLEKHWTTLAQIVNDIRSALPKTQIVIAATIAPNSSKFGDGAPGVSFDQPSKQSKTARIKEYLENALKFAKSQHIPIADTYHDSMDGQGNGKLTYINASDHIHYSGLGRSLFETKLFDTIVTQKLLEY